MGTGVDWPGANKSLGPPPGKDESQVRTLRVFSNGVECVSCWQLDEEELAEVVRTGKVFVSIFSGSSQPPVYVGSETSVREMSADYGVWPK